MITEISGKDIELSMGEINDPHDPHNQGNPYGRDRINYSHHQSIGEIHQKFGHLSTYAPTLLISMKREKQDGVTLRFIFLSLILL